MVGNRVTVNVGTNDVTATFTPVPEPAGGLGVAAGVRLAVWVRRRRRGEVVNSRSDLAEGHSPSPGPPRRPALRSRGRS